MSASDSISILGIQFHLYGLILGLATVLGGSMAEHLAKKFYADVYRENMIWEVMGWMLGLGVVGARAYHVFDLWDYYAQNLIEVFSVWNGGLGIYGGVVGGVVGLYIYKWLNKKKQLQIPMYLDVIGPSLLLAQAIGRWGNYFNQELYGKPTNLPWGLWISPERRLQGFENMTHFHPLFLYEMGWNVVGFLVLYRFLLRGKIQLQRGNYFLLYLLWYGLGRAVLEPMRIVYWRVGEVPVATGIGMGLVFVTIGFIVFRKKNYEWTVLDN